MLVELREPFTLDHSSEKEGIDGTSVSVPNAHVFIPILILEIIFVWWGHREGLLAL